MAESTKREVVRLFLLGSGTGSLKTLSPALRGAIAFGLIDLYRPHLSGFTGFNSLVCVAKRMPPDTQMEQLKISANLACKELLQEEQREGELKAFDQTYPRNVSGRQLLLSKHGGIYELTWSYEQWLHKKGRYVGDPYEVREKILTTSIRVPTERQLGELLGPSRLFALQSMLAKQSLDRLRRVEDLVYRARATLDNI